MSRRLLSTAAALMLAGGVYLSAGTAEASNMGFKLERSFSYVAGAQNLYYVSFPLFNGLGDISAGTDCTGSDGLITAADALCDLATDRDMVASGQIMAIQHQNEATCAFEGLILLKLGPSVRLSGSFTDELTTPANREVGYFINAFQVAGDPDLENRAVIVGSHDPSWAGKMISRTCPLAVLTLPYHTMYRTAAEVLCGLEGIDWVDDNMDGKPDTCEQGLYDPVSGVGATVQTLVNGVGGQGYQAFNPGTLLFVGTNFDLTPGDGYVFNMNDGYQDRLWLPPHF